MKLLYLKLFFLLYLKV